ncbi:hypothetical protein G6O67_003304 [Ophiocordyceps sinensis]|uniref:Uncharacterized protein n=1 Tax=Ophiocordyceps sinensis TaxID=72228 RepID=A0A8H4V855_9HYPO|nr:hypothetical protein G6O67_003304 [Ophiocordyceps sinensis]
MQVMNLEGLPVGLFQAQSELVLHSQYEIDHVPLAGKFLWQRDEVVVVANERRHQVVHAQHGGMAEHPVRQVAIVLLHAQVLCVRQPARSLPANRLECRKRRRSVGRVVALLVAEARHECQDGVGKVIVQMRRHLAGQGVLPDHVHLVVEARLWLLAVLAVEEGADAVLDLLEFVAPAVVHVVVEDGQECRVSGDRTQLLDGQPWKGPGRNVSQAVPLVRLAGLFGFKGAVNVDPVVVLGNEVLDQGADQVGKRIVGAGPGFQFRVQLLFCPWGHDALWSRVCLKLWFGQGRMKPLYGYSLLVQNWTCKEADASVLDQGGRNWPTRSSNEGPTLIASRFGDWAFLFPQQPPHTRRAPPAYAVKVVDSNGLAAGLSKQCVKLAPCW